MRYRRFLVILVFAYSALAEAQTYCKRLLYDEPNYNCFTSVCFYFCPEPPRRVSVSDRLTPGFFTEEKGAKQVVVGVIPNSPAYYSGVQMGDELLEVDNTPVPLTSDGFLWEHGNYHILKLRRDSELVITKIVTVQTRELLARLPADSAPQLASFRPERPNILALPFLSGMLLHSDGPNFVIDRIIKRSPAYRAGLRSGDTITLRGDNSVESLEYSDERKEITINVLRGKEKGTMTVRFASLSELLQTVSLK